MHTFHTSNFSDDDRIGNAIYEIRGQRVMMDSDIAELYGVATKRVNEQVNVTWATSQPISCFSLHRVNGKS